MVDAEVAESKALIASVINQAIKDALSYPNPNAPKNAYIKYQRQDQDLNPSFVSNDPEYLSWDARKFLSGNSRLFTAYATMLDMDAESLAEKINNVIKQFDDSGKNGFKILNYY